MESPEANILMWKLSDASETARLGAHLAPLLTPGMVVYLEGDLGAGKTFLVAALLHARGFSGAVKSPTYALVEVYSFSRLYLYHFDFYRFNAPEEFLDAGLDEYFRSDAICLIEWPQKAAGFLPPSDLRIVLQMDGFMPAERGLTINAYSPEGLACLKTLSMLLRPNAAGS